MASDNNDNAWIGAGSYLLGGAISSAISAWNNRQQLKYAKDAAEQQINLANTAHQREVRDLRAAGLNPILSAQGSGSGNFNPVAYNPDSPSQVGQGLQQAANLYFTAKNAETSRIAAETQAWQIVDAKDFGRAGFEIFGWGTGGKAETVRTLRINKVTGDCYTLDGKKFKVKDVVPDGAVTVRLHPAHSGRSASALPPSTFKKIIKQTANDLLPRPVW